MVELNFERRIAAAPERVFAWLTDPANLAAAPMTLRAGWAKNSPPPGVGAVRQVVAAGLWVREEITGYDPPHRYSYRIIRSVPALGHHGGTVRVTPAGDGAHVDWSTAYNIPAWAGGGAMNALTAPLLRWNLGSVLAACARELER
ncbi:SRPBCC family protein [Mycolicibacterium brumae]|uniref:SRPBCC family protein n=1 Tax=Mycolicibacterium brumae TaxID=85968 RepID=A0A2G5PDC0_9MYCO|nr:SRPBCC family protein [Mycolicibacterium brumae]MCV7191783.1 SRPBCC family protein [Mycolicibacterium brumae]PIB76332.1 SRPBCC family protein [Mycolicibacterium brumae]RWA15841.1 hypothetical protein MBRU_09840 [Mycolicibacterium brumae DSM 44177]UWW07089.1 SRPBCC family protein [Mycolicibacterium brumae]